MKVFNLDKFKGENQVQLDGKNYKVKQMTIAEYFENDLVEELAEAKDEKAKLTVMLNRLEKSTDIPMSVLKNQPMPVISVLLTIVQGADPETEADKKEATQGK